MALTGVMIAVMAAGAVGCGGDGDSGEPAAARDDGGGGEVTFYCGLSVEDCQKMADSYKEESGVNVTVTRLGGTEAMARLLAEDQSNVHEADVVVNGCPECFVTLQQKRLLAKYVPTGTAQFREEFRDYTSSEYFSVVWSWLAPIIYNTKAVSDPPKSYEDLADPKYAGKVSFCDPKISGACWARIKWLSEKYGWEYFEALKKNKLFLGGSEASLPQLAAQGERPIALDGADSIAYQLINSGSPLKVVTPEEGQFFDVGTGAVLAKAPHADAAKKFLDWLTSRTGQELLAKSFWTSPLPDVTYASPKPALPDPQSLIVVSLDDRVNPGDIKERWTSIFGN